MMQKTRSLSIRTIALAIASVLAVTLCFTGTARAALAYFSPDYQAEFNTTQLSVGLSEKGNEAEKATIIEDGKLLSWIDEDNVTIVPGKFYTEELAAVNTSETYDQYVRVVVKKYWTKQQRNDADELMYDDEGNPIMVKDTTVDPDLIKLTLAEGWEEDKDNHSPEQIVLYSRDVLGHDADDNSRVFVEGFTIDPAVVMAEDARNMDPSTVITNEDGTKKTITYTMVYTLDGYSFNIEAEVDAVQTHNAPDAVKSVWGYTDFTPES